MKDRRWTLDEWTRPPGIAKADIQTKYGGVLLTQIFQMPAKPARLVVEMHNADINELEAENAKLRKVVEVLQRGQPIDALIVSYLKVAGDCEGGLAQWFRTMADALKALLPEEGDDG